MGQTVLQHKTRQGIQCGKEMNKTNTERKTSRDSTYKEQVGQKRTSCQGKEGFIISRGEKRKGERKEKKRGKERRRRERVGDGKKMTEKETLTYGSNVLLMLYVVM